MITERNLIKQNLYKLIKDIRAYNETYDDTISTLILITSSNNEKYREISTGELSEVLTMLHSSDHLNLKQNIDKILD